MEKQATDTAKIALAGYQTISSKEFDTPDAKFPKIFKETFEEKNFYPEKENLHKRKKSNKASTETPADKPLSEKVVIDEYLNISSDIQFIKVSGKKVFRLKFDDGSIYQIGKGFIKSA